MVGEGRHQRDAVDIAQLSAEDLAMEVIQAADGGLLAMLQEHVLLFVERRGPVIAQRLGHPLWIVIADHMDMPALHKLFDTLVRRFHEVDSQPQALAGLLTQLIDKTAAQLLVDHIDIGHAVGSGKAPAQRLRVAAGRTAGH